MRWEEPQPAAELFETRESHLKSTSVPGLTQQTGEESANLTELEGLSKGTTQAVAMHCNAIQQYKVDVSANNVPESVI